MPLNQTKLNLYLFYLSGKFQVFIQFVVFSFPFLEYGEVCEKKSSLLFVDKNFLSFSGQD